MAIDPQRLKQLFLSAADIAAPSERAALLDRECAQNFALRTEIESLLAAREQAAPSLKKPDATVGPGLSAEKPGDKRENPRLIHHQC